MEWGTHVQHHRTEEEDCALIPLWSNKISKHQSGICHEMDFNVFLQHGALLYTGTAIPRPASQEEWSWHTTGCNAAGTAPGSLLSTKSGVQLPTSAAIHQLWVPELASLCYEYQICWTQLHLSALVPPCTSSVLLLWLGEVLRNEHPAGAAPESLIIASLNPLLCICLKHLRNVIRVNRTCPVQRTIGCHIVQVPF